MISKCKRLPRKLKRIQAKFAHHSKAKSEHNTVSSLKIVKGKLLISISQWTGPNLLLIFVPIMTCKSNSGSNGRLDEVYETVSVS